jgi:RNA polymerase sigma-70 factor (ECF subfamily)
MTSAPIPLETLLAHRDWVRAVARAVVRDPNAADDVEQETWLAALSTPPRHASSLRGWFGAVARSRARRIGRGESRREAREIAASRDEATASAAEIAELADTHRRVVQAVVELEEPLRAAILLRYFEGLSVEDVAARTSSPLETTRSRLKRGVAKLRERLSRELGADERPWALALAPLIDWPRAPGLGASAAGGGVVMASTSKAVAVVAGFVLLIGVGAVVAPRWTSRNEPGVAAAPESAPVAGKPPATPAKPAPPPRVQRPRATQDAKEAAPAEENARVPAETVRERLERVKVAITCRRTPARDAFAELASKCGVEIFLSAEVDALLGARPSDSTMDMQFDQEIVAKQLLDLFVTVKGFAWTVEEPRVVLVPKDGKRDPSKALIALIALPPWTPPTPITVVGRVTDEAGVVVVGAEVWHVSGGARPVATTDVAGRYEVKLLQPYGSLEARAPFQLASLCVSVTGEPAAQVTCDLTTRGAAGAASVRVTDADGNPMPTTWVYVGRRDDLTTKLPDGRTTQVRALQGLTDKNGVATFPAVPPGASPVVVEPRGFVPFQGTVEIVASKTAPQLDVKLAKKSPLSERLAAQRISFTFSGARPAEVVRFVNTVAQLNVILDPALQSKLDAATVSLSATDRPLDEALRAFCGQIGAKLVVRDKEDIVWITTDKR